MTEYFAVLQQPKTLLRHKNRDITIVGFTLVFKHWLTQSYKLYDLCQQVYRIDNAISKLTE